MAGFFKRGSVVAAVLCALAVALAYANSLGNEFALDDGHSIQSNAWVRSLRHVPRYFIDASTFSTLCGHVDYRPLLQTTYALDYALAGYDVRWWRATNLAIHLVVSVTIFFLGRRLIGSRGLAPLPGLEAGDGDLAALAAALLFALHPIGSGVVNYVSTRSSSLVAALVLPALVLYLRSLADARHARLARGTSLLLFAAALFTKVEAVSLLPVLVLAELLLDPARRDLGLGARLTASANWRRLAPFAVVTLAYLPLWWAQTALDSAATRAGARMTPWVYLLTQLRAWWYYLGLVVAPLDLVADYPSYPLSHSLAEPRVLLALAGWLAVLVVALAAWRRAPVASFLLLSFFVYLAPHSSVMPLSEPVNEHRPYLALTGLFLLAAASLLAVLGRVVRRPRLVLALVVLLLAVPLAALTRERNRVWRDPLTLWGDTARKVPDSPRAQMNYGLALMRRARYAEAEARFRDALRLAPRYHLAHTNLGIVLAAQGKDAEARSAYDRAVQIAPAEDAPFFWRGRFRASRGDHAGAVADFETAARNSSSPFREWVALSVLLDASGRGDEAARYASRAQAIDPAGFAGERDAFVATVLRRTVASAKAPPEEAVRVMNEGVAVMAAGRLAQAEGLFRRAIALAPAYDRAHTNLGIVLAAQGRVDDGRAEHDRAVALAPNDPSPYYWRGRHLARHGDPAGAAADFEAAVARGGSGPRELAALAEMLARAGRAADAERMVARGEAADPAAFARERAAFVAGVLGAPG
jgi:Flp pilus assembly protein TadD